MELTGAQWKAENGDNLIRLCGWSPELVDRCAAGIDARNAQCAAAKHFWETASYEEKERVLLQDLAAARCHPEYPKHNPNACNSCGPIHVCLRMLKEGKL